MSVSNVCITKDPLGWVLANAEALQSLVNGFEPENKDYRSGSAEFDIGQDEVTVAFDDAFPPGSEYALAFAVQVPASQNDPGQPIIQQLSKSVSGFTAQFKGFSVPTDGYILNWQATIKTDEDS